MGALIVLVLIAIGSGVAAGLQTPIIAFSSSKIGLLEGVLFPHLVGSLTALILVRSFGGKGFKAIPTLPWFAFLPGILGVMAVLGLTFSTLRLGATATVVLFLVAQLIVGAVVGHFGWLGLPLKPLDPKNTERGFAVCGGLVGGEDGLSWV